MCIYENDSIQPCNQPSKQRLKKGLILTITGSLWELL